MLKKITAIAISIGFAAGLFAGGSKDANKQTEPKQEIIIAAAASLTNAMNECITLYGTNHPAVKVTPTYASSGALRKQIEQGAPADLFFSASEKHMTALMDEDLIMNDTKTDLLKNEVVLIVPKGSTAGIASFNDVDSDKVTQAAIGEPSSVPAGSYAKEVFTSLGIYGNIESGGKLVFGKDVRQVLSYVEQGNVQAGAVYSTDAAISDSVTVVATAPDGSHRPIVYPAAIVKTTEHEQAAKDFLAFLESSDALDIFTKYGFISVK
ncbi:MAG: molybdate ABC transporter substrate-binding protein [Treponema sp.]|jgi:molybdate transport system substrate-binding protein|nr:molybdate ABC transporter substrate-binding protein [Treponema sp.]